MPDPMRGKALPLVMEVYGWLSWATSGTTRGMRNRPSEAVLLRNVGGKPEVPPGGCVDREDDESRDSGGMARPWAGVARLPGRGGGALAAPAPAHRTRPLTLPPEESATTPASAPAQTEAPGRNAGRKAQSPDGVGGGANQRTGARATACPSPPTVSTPPPLPPIPEAMKAAGTQAGTRPADDTGHADARGTEDPLITDH